MINLTLVERGIDAYRAVIDSVLTLQNNAAPLLQSLKQFMASEHYSDVLYDYRNETCSSLKDQPHKNIFLDYEHGVKDNKIPDITIFASIYDANVFELHNNPIVWKNTLNRMRKQITERRCSTYLRNNTDIRKLTEKHGVTLELQEAHELILDLEQTKETCET